MSIEAMKQALEALNRINRDSVSREHAQLMSEEAITALRQAIEQAEQAEQAQPVAEGWVLVPANPSEAHLQSMAVRYDHGLGMDGFYDSPIYQKLGGATHAQRLECAKSIARQMYEEATGQGFFKLTATPPRQPWAGLTDEDKQIAFDDTQEGGGFWEFADAIEATLRKKNHG